MPQWRGSRKTARFFGPDVDDATLDRAAMEGQSEDCPFLGSASHGNARQSAAMEGQSEDCPFQRNQAGTSDRNGWPQWRGSRKTARFADHVEGVDPGVLAAMEGQSEDCPFPSGLCGTERSRSGPQWRGSRKTARFSPTG